MARSISYKVLHRDIKYPRLEFKTGELLCVLPNGDNPDVLLMKYKHWINKQKDFIAECLKAAQGRELALRGDDEFKCIISSCVMKASGELGSIPNKVFFRTMRTKWASLSSKKNLTVNLLMKYLPKRLIEYIVFHELTHIIEKRHNEKFWKTVSMRFKNYPELERDLFIYWFLVIEKRT